MILKMFDIVTPVEDIPGVGFAYVTRPMECHNDTMGLRVRLMSMEGWESKWYRRSHWKFKIRTEKYINQKLKVGDFVISNNNCANVGRIAKLEIIPDGTLRGYRVQTIADEYYDPNDEYYYHSLVYVEDVVRFARDSYPSFEL